MQGWPRERWYFLPMQQQRVLLSYILCEQRDIEMNSRNRPAEQSFSTPGVVRSNCLFVVPIVPQGHRPILASEKRPLRLERDANPLQKVGFVWSRIAEIALKHAPQVHLGGCSIHPRCRRPPVAVPLLKRALHSKVMFGPYRQFWYRFSQFNMLVPYVLQHNKWRNGSRRGFYPGLDSSHWSTNHLGC